LSISSALSTLAEVRASLRNICELRLGGIPDLHRLDVVAHQLLQMCRQSSSVILERAARWSDALRDVEDDAGEAVLIDVDLLAVWDLTELAVRKKQMSASLLPYGVWHHWRLAHT
jgi:hypothetical protein